MIELDFYFELAAVRAYFDIIVAPYFFCIFL